MGYYPRRTSWNSANYRYVADKEAPKPPAERMPGHIGDIGAKLTLTVTVTRKQWRDTVYGGSYLHEFVTDTGSVLTWWASKDTDMIPGSLYTIVGTVKGHTVFKDVPQTTLTRCTYAAPANPTMVPDETGEPFTCQVKYDAVAGSLMVKYAGLGDWVQTDAQELHNLCFQQALKENN